MAPYASGDSETSDEHPVWPTLQLVWNCSNCGHVVALEGEGKPSPITGREVACERCAAMLVLRQGPALPGDLLHAIELQHGFIGYGTYEAPVWSVSLEPGGPTSDALKLYDGWVAVGRTEMCDPVALDPSAQWFTRSNKVQPTWGSAIAFALAAYGAHPDDVSLERVREEQRERWCRDKKAAHLHLSALPSPSYGDRQLRDLSWSYRIDTIALRLRTYKPRAVIFMGSGRSVDFEAIAGTSLSVDTVVELPHGGLGVLAYHPNAHGTSPRQEYAALGHLIFERAK
jgi:hypothetical protein